MLNEGFKCLHYLSNYSGKLVYLVTDLDRNCRPCELLLIVNHSKTTHK